MGQDDINIEKREFDLQLESKDTVCDFKSLPRAIAWFNVTNICILSDTGVIKRWDWCHMVSVSAHDKAGFKTRAVCERTYRLLVSGM